MLVHHVVSLHGAFKNKNPNMQAYKYIWKGNMVVWSVFVKNTNIMSSYSPLDYTRIKFWTGPKPFSFSFFSVGPTPVESLRGEQFF